VQVQPGGGETSERVGEEGEEMVAIQEEMFEDKTTERVVINRL